MIQHIAQGQADIFIEKLRVDWSNAECLMTRPFMTSVNRSKHFGAFIIDSGKVH